jgi:hypothetical protein
LLLALAGNCFSLLGIHYHRPFCSCNSEPKHRFQN